MGCGFMSLSFPLVLVFIRSVSLFQPRLPCNKCWRLFRLASFIATGQKKRSALISCQIDLVSNVAIAILAKKTLLNNLVSTILFNLRLDL